MTPSNRRYSLHIPVEKLRAGQGFVQRVRLDHLREREEKLVCAEGESFFSNLPESTADLYCAGDRVYAYRSSNHFIKHLPSGSNYVLRAKARRIVSIARSDGTPAIFALCSDAMCSVAYDSSMVRRFAPVPSLTNLVNHHERLIGANGERICYSTAGDYLSWGSKSEQGTGMCDLPPSQAGEVVDVVTLDGKVFFLREYGITRFTGYVDVYTFRLEDMAYDGGKILSFAAVFSDAAFFFTEQGLVRFDGVRIQRAEGAGDEDIDLTQPIRVDTLRGRALVALVQCRDGSKAVYLYEPRQRRGRFVHRNAVAVVAGEEVTFMRGAEAFRLEGRALSAEGDGSVTVELDFTSLGEGNKRLEAVLLEGVGEVACEVTGEDGVVRRRAGAAGAWLDFGVGVPGDRVKLVVRTEDVDIAIGSLTLRVRKEERI